MIAAVTRRERRAWGLLIVGALTIRLLDLGSRPYQFDEGQIAYAAYLRELRAGYPDMASPSFKPSGDVLIVTDAARDLLAGRLRTTPGPRSSCARAARR